MMGSQTEAMPTARSPLQQVPQPSEPATEPNGNGALVPRIVLGIVCGLVLANTVRKIIMDIALLMPASFADVFDYITFAASCFIDVLFPLVLAVPPIILLVYAIWKKAVSDRLALVMLVIWWATWILGLVVYLTRAHGVVPDCVHR